MSGEPAGRLLLVEDDPVHREVLGEALAARGFQVTGAAGVEEALAAARAASPTHAVVDLRLSEGGGEGSAAEASGLRVVAALRRMHPGCRIVVLTGYASIATAVEAIKLGAVHYLAKPADADEVVAAFAREEGDPEVPPPSRPLSVRHLEWEHLQRVLLEHGGNVSAAARALGMHRRTLQRKLRKRPPASAQRR